MLMEISIASAPAGRWIKTLEGSFAMLNRIAAAVERRVEIRFVPRRQKGRPY